MTPRPVSWSRRRVQTELKTIPWHQGKLLGLPGPAQEEAPLGAWVTACRVRNWGATFPPLPPSSSSLTKSHEVLWSLTHGLSQMPPPGPREATDDNASGEKAPPESDVLDQIPVLPLNKLVTSSKCLTSPSLSFPVCKTAPIKLPWPCTHELIHLILGAAHEAGTVMIPI